ncbi:MAG TPA: hypothetical protein VHZ95_06050 [Polyangiales bacterium]|jgi:hypothetical protein|nr:hypothetical protein [Polyangiales bacterium]
MMTRLAKIAIALLCSLLATRRATAQEASDSPPLDEQGATVAPTPPPSAAEPIEAAPLPPSAAKPEAPPEQNPYPSALRHPITREELARIRALLAPDRVEEQPIVHGDAGAAFAIGLSVDAIFHSDVGFRLFDDRHADARFGVWVGYDLLTIAPHWILSAELGAGFENLEGDGLFGGDARAHLSSQTFQGSVSARWEACSFLSPQLRASGGVSLFDFELQVDDESAAHEHAVSGFGALGAGVLIHSPPRVFENRGGKFASLGFGLLIEGGYALRSPIDLALENPSGSQRIPISEAKLGRLDLSGPYVRTSLVARF